MTVREFTKLPLVLAVLIVSGVGVFYSRLPVRVPIHLGLGGVPDVLGPRWTLLAAPAIIVVLWVLFLLLSRVERFSASLRRSASVYCLVVDALAAVVAVTFVSQLIAASGSHLAASRLETVAMAVLFMAVGNQLGRVKRNGILGVRVRWTLDDEVVWGKTNRLFGYLLVATGILAVFAALTSTLGELLLTAGLIASAIVAVAYSYLLHRSRHNLAKA